MSSSVARCEGIRSISRLLHKPLLAFIRTSARIAQTISELTPFGKLVALAKKTFPENSRPGASAWKRRLYRLREFAKRIGYWIVALSAKHQLIPGLCGSRCHAVFPGRPAATSRKGIHSDLEIGTTRRPRSILFTITSPFSTPAELPQMAEQV